ncbi:Membrane protein [Cupriavidus oxalaticus]|uniref:porin n=1 Tax=Cupriavidus oxalaticus TaxID=96344 RepID=UPI003F7354BD
MKKTIVLLAASAAAGAAHAQSSVALFGIADIGVEYNNNVGPEGDNLFRLSSGNQSGSRWGLRGTEDLGAGLKAVFLLESGFDLDTGNSAQGGRLFGRNAYVGVESRYGALLFGRQQTALRDFNAFYDPAATSDRYGILGIAPEFGARADNTVKYAGTFGALSGAAFYSFQNNGNEVAGSNVFGRDYGAYLSYATGPVAVGVGYDDVHVGTPANQAPSLRRYAIAGTYTAGQAKIFAGYRLAKAFDGAMLPGAQAANAGANLYWLGLNYKLTPAFSLMGAAYYQDFRHTGSDPWQFVVTGDYTFSKRTDLYASVAYALNKDQSYLGVNGYNSGSGSTAVINVQPGQNQLGAVMGIRHRF